MEIFDCLKTLIGLGKYQLRPLAGFDSAATAEEVTGTATDLDLVIIVLLITSSFSSNPNFFPSPSILLLFDRKTDQNAEVLPPEAGSLRSPPTNLELDRRNGIATDRERQNEGSLSIRLESLPNDPTASPPEEDEEDGVAQQKHGRTAAQSGQRLLRRSRRHTWQIPLRRRFEGCFGHFHASSSSA